MAPNNLIGCRRSSAVREQLSVNTYCFNFTACIRLFVKVLIERYVNIFNKLIFSQTGVYRSVSYTGLQAKFTFGVHLLCTRPNIVYSSINLSDIKFITYKSHAFVRHISGECVHFQRERLLHFYICFLSGRESTPKRNNCLT